ncbi:MAG: hypothetical protein H5U40_14615, partial [Polyangiaceae bacterium]|nr:hypothetical protein [Polyangiaceae bacterium]
MLPGPVIVRPSLAQDRPGMVRLVSVGVLSLACGLVLSRAGAGRSHLLSESATEDIGAQVAVVTVLEAAEPEPIHPPIAPIEAAPVEAHAPAIASAPVGGALGTTANALTARTVTPAEQR